MSRFIDLCVEPVAVAHRVTLCWERKRGVFDRRPLEVRRTQKSASSMFGASASSNIGLGDVESWGIEAEAVPSAVDWLRDQAPPSGARGDWLNVEVDARFMLKDPESGAVLPFQGSEHYGEHDWSGGWGEILGLSRMRLRVSERSTCALVLSLPFEDAGLDLGSYVASLQHLVPFRLSDKHWNRWQLNKSGTRYYSRKIESPLAACRRPTSALT